MHVSSSDAMSDLIDFKARDGIMPEALCHHRPEVLMFDRSQNLSMM